MAAHLGENWGQKFKALLSHVMVRLSRLGLKCVCCSVLESDPEHSCKVKDAKVQEVQRRFVEGGIFILELMAEGFEVI